jgi:hypothetical protein
LDGQLVTGGNALHEATGIIRKLSRSGSIRRQASDYRK